MAQDLGIETTKDNVTKTNLLHKALWEEDFDLARQRLRLGDGIFPTGDDAGRLSALDLALINLAPLDMFDEMMKAIEAQHRAVDVGAFLLRGIKAWGPDLSRSEFARATGWMIEALSLAKSGHSAMVVGLDLVEILPFCVRDETASLMELTQEVCESIKKTAQAHVPFVPTKIFLEACRSKSLPLFRACLALGADPNEASEGGVCPLHAACANNAQESLSMVTALLAAGAAHTSRTERGGTPASYATTVGCVAKLQALSAAGADIFALGPKGKSLVAIAVAGEHGECASWLRAQRERKELSDKLSTTGAPARPRPMRM